MLTDKEGYVSTAITGTLGALFLAPLGIAIGSGVELASGSHVTIAGHDMKEVFVDSALAALVIGIIEFGFIFPMISGHNKTAYHSHCKNPNCTGLGW